MELIAAVKVDHDIVAGRIIANEVLCLSLSTEIPAFSKRRMHAGILSQRGPVEFTYVTTLLRQFYHDLPSRRRRDQTSVGAVGSIFSEFCFSNCGVSVG